MSVTEAKKTKYAEYKNLNLPQIAKEIQVFWEENKIFEETIKKHEGKKSFVFYEGPPSANGMPGIHHVMSRTLKDVFCRYKTLKGFQVKRKAGWDTHGLPVELQVENKLNLKKEDIGTKISIADYNAECKKDVMKFKDAWDDLTIKIGFWLDLKNPYITFKKDYVESVWCLLKKLYDKGLLYKGYSIQPYSPAAGTGLSSHELNYQGCYRTVKDTTAIAQFKVIRNQQSEFLFKKNIANADIYFLAWTTTPWTLPSNTALAVGKEIEYLKILTTNKYTQNYNYVICAKELVPKVFDEEKINKSIKYSGKDFEGMSYEQLLPYVQPKDGSAFKVIIGDFVSTQEGTGIVHIAPSFGADDFRMAKQYGLGSLTLVDKAGKFVDEVTDFAGRYVKNYEDDKDYHSVDIDICIKLKKENKAYKVEKYEHSYPHCWRTDKPIIYYPLQSWFIKTTDYKDKMIELNNTINWKPASTGTGRFGNWLENMVDWNLSRSRFWGTPLPIWKTEDDSEKKCIGSADELKTEIEKSVKAGFMTNTLPDNFDLHRPFVDEIILVSDNGKKMFRETDLIDVWFDSGAMPYAQWHYPFENINEFNDNFPADYIAEGVDQTRGWFYTLHAIAVMLFDSVAFKNVIANGMVLDKDGNKMSKRLGNAIDPFELIEKFGPDATRWYMITNAQPWDNLKFDVAGVEEVQRKFFGTLYNTYTFLALYANIDNFCCEEAEIPVNNRHELDRWILSLLNSLTKEFEEKMDDYEPAKAARAIQTFVIDHLSNWYVRLSRRRFWKGSYTEDKISAFQTLHKCLEVVAQLTSPIAPFFTDRLFKDLNKASVRYSSDSVHLSEFPKYDSSCIDEALERRMNLAQQISSMALSLRKKSGIKVRQPLNKILIPLNNNFLQKDIEQVKNIILSEINVKKIEFVSGESKILVKRIKPKFTILGPKYAKLMGNIVSRITSFNQKDIETFEAQGTYKLLIKNQTIILSLNEVEISFEDIPGCLVANENNLTVALDVTITSQLKEEGIVRELVNKIQNVRKQNGFDVTDRINVSIEKHNELNNAIINNLEYICTEILANTFNFSEKLSNGIEIEINNFKTNILVTK